MNFSQQLIVLVGGKGTRLGELTRATPKPLMTIDSDRVFLDYLLKAALRQGFREVLLLAGTFGEQLIERYGNRTIDGAAVHVIVEPKPMGTGGAFRHVFDHLAPTFVAVNGDTFFDISFRALDHRLQERPGLLGALAVRRMPDAGRYGCLDIEDGRIAAFREKDPAASGQAGLINGGVYALRKDAIALLPPGPASIESDLFPAIARQGQLGAHTADGYFCDIGLPDTLSQARADLPGRLRPALFLDRDGVLNRDIGYLHRPEDLEWIDGAREAVRVANERGWAVIVITNQAGVARGYYGEGDVARLHRHMQEQLHAAGAFADGFYHCPYHADAVVERYRIADHADRKPNPGMLLRAARDHGLDLKRSVLIGDQDSDMEAARRAGVRPVRFPGGNLWNCVDEHAII